MNKQQKRILIVLGIILIVAFGGILYGIDAAGQLSKSRAEYQTTLEALKASYDATATAIR